MKSQATRSRTQNRKIARQLLAEKLEVMEKGEWSRKRIREGVASRKKRSKDKKARRKYRKLAAEKEGVGVGGAVIEGKEDEDEEDDDEDDEDDEDGEDIEDEEDQDEAEAVTETEHEGMHDLHGTVENRLEDGKADKISQR